MAPIYSCCSHWVPQTEHPLKKGKILIKKMQSVVCVMKDNRLPAERLAAWICFGDTQGNQDLREY